MTTDDAALVRQLEETGGARIVQPVQRMAVEHRCSAPALPLSAGLTAVSSFSSISATPRLNRTPAFSAAPRSRTGTIGANSGCSCSASGAAASVIAACASTIPCSAKPTSIASKKTWSGVAAYQSDALKKFRRSYRHEIATKI